VKLWKGAKRGSKGSRRRSSKVEDEDEEEDRDDEEKADGDEDKAPEEASANPLGDVSRWTAGLLRAPMGLGGGGKRRRF